MSNVTIKEVAERAGCSAMTVSNVINKRRTVKPEIAGKVMKVIDELGYQPSQWARHLALRRMNKNTSSPLTRRFGCIMDAPATGKYADPYFGEVMQALELELNRRNYELSFVEQWGDLSGSERLGRMLNPENIDILVLLNCELLLPQVKRYIKNIVVIGSFFSDREVDYVSCDMVNSAKMATDYLLSLGHRNIVYMGPVIPLEYASHEREMGYKLALMNHPDNPAPHVVHLKTDNWADAYEESLCFLSRPDRPTGVFAHSDITAIAVIKAANKLGLKVPEDLSVVGFDDVYLGELSQPALTTIRVNKTGMGQVVAQCGVGRIENPNIPPRINMLPGELVVRESCAPPKK
jgi:DNA-binding LacI/PurR family transcriptional regulator